MKMITLTIAGLLMLLSCDNNTKGNSSPADSTAVKDTKEMKVIKDNNETQLPWKELLSGNQCRIENPVNLVITNQARFDSLWSKAFKKDMPQEKPAVDFSKNSVIAIFLGTVNSGGHSAVITSIQHNAAGGYMVEAEHKLPGKSCIATTAIEFPYYFALAGTVISGKTAFTIIKKEVECE
jgi:hypothetical protein